MPYSAKGFFEISEDMVQILLMLEVLFTFQDTKVEDLVCGAPSGSEPSLFFSNYLFSLGSSICGQYLYGSLTLYLNGIRCLCFVRIKTSLLFSG